MISLNPLVVIKPTFFPSLDKIRLVATVVPCMIRSVFFRNSFKSKLQSFAANRKTFKTPFE